MALKLRPPASATASTRTASNDRPRFSLAGGRLGAHHCALALECQWTLMEEKRPTRTAARDDIPANSANAAVSRVISMPRGAAEAAS